MRVALFLRRPLSLLTVEMRYCPPTRRAAALSSTLSLGDSFHGRRFGHDLHAQSSPRLFDPRAGCAQPPDAQQRQMGTAARRQREPMKPCRRPTTSPGIRAPAMFVKTRSGWPPHDCAPSPKAAAICWCSWTTTTSWSRTSLNRRPPFTSNTRLLERLAPAVWSRSSSMSRHPEIRHLLPMLALRTVPSARWSNNPRDSDSIPWGAGLCVTRSVANAYRQLLERLDLIQVLGPRGSACFSGDDDVFRLGRGRRRFWLRHVSAAAGDPPDSGGSIEAVLSRPARSRPHVFSQHHAV